MTHRPKKSLGQNFLKSEAILGKMAEAGDIQPGEVILEIGPGKGSLTEKLLQKNCLVIAVEKDRELVEFLKMKFAKEIAERSLVLVHEGILDFQINNYKPKAVSYKLIANIPYNITGAILKKFLTEERQPERMVLMVQEEVAIRILGSPRHGGARNGKESLLSISVQAYGEPKMIARVDKRYFRPRPKVDSAILSIKNISRKNFNSPPSSLPLAKGEKNTINEAKFWEIVKAGFAHKRKKLSSNLKTLLKNGSKASVLGELGNKRAEDLTLSDWLQLAKNC